jgi:RNA polymerase sigma-70 factor (ECF subfamily)
MAENESDENILVERASGGDMSAFREIVDRYQRQIYSISYDFTGNHHDAEDILQEVLIKVYRSLNRFRGDSRLSTWLHRITINTCLDKTRRASLPVASSEELVPDRFAADSPSGNPEKSTEATRIQSHIENALRTLTPLERSVFILRNYKELPIKDVAQVLGRSEGTVKNMLWRALKKLQKELEFYRKELGLEAIK